MAISINVHYTDPTSDPHKQPFTLWPGEVNTTETSLALSGQGAANYSTHVNDNFVQLLENFASVHPPKNGTLGQLWYSVDNKELRVLSNIGVGTGGARVDSWTPVGVTITVGSTPPTLTNQLWYDTSNALAANHQLNIYNNIAHAWQPVTKQWLVSSPTPPANKTILWYNTAGIPPELYVFNTVQNAWQTVVSHDAALLTGKVPDSVLTTSNIGGNAATATTATYAIQLAIGRSISVTGGATASGVSFDGTSNIALNVTDMDASKLTAGTVSVDRIGSGGTRATGFYLAGTNVWTALPYIPDSYTKTESDTQLATKPNKDSITTVGFASNDTTLPYFRRTSDNQVYYLQPKIPYVPAPVATTLAGYGITDAYTKAETAALIPPASPITGVLSGSGWTRFANGLTFQWGQGPALGDDGAVMVNLIRPGTILNVQVTAIGVSTSGVGPCFLSDAWSGTNFRVSNNYNTGPARPFAWFAVTVTTS